MTRIRAAIAAWCRRNLADLCPSEYSAWEHLEGLRGHRPPPEVD